MSPAVLSGKAKDFALVSARECRDPAGELVGKGEQILEGNVFAEWNEVNLVVPSYAGAIHAHDQRGVVVTPSAVLLRQIRTYVTDHKRGLLLARNRIEHMLKARVAFLKRRGRFRPHNQVGMGGIGRADNLAIGCAGLGDSGDVRFALLISEPVELGDVAVPLAWTAPEVVGSYVQVWLDQHSGCRRRRLGRRDRHAKGSYHQQNRTRDPPQPPI